MRRRAPGRLIVPGLGNSGPDHWQSRWAARLPNVHLVAQDDWEARVASQWIARIVETAARCQRPTVAVAHSLGVIALVEAVPDLPRPLAGAFLVSPPGEATLATLPGIDPAFRPVPTAPLPFPSLVAGSRGDPYATLAEMESMALDWGSRFLDAGDAGHINADSGHGPWPEGLMAFGGFLGRL